jgi:5'-methylthioinosine phosphorylase
VTNLAIIGGTGLTELPGLEIIKQIKIITPYGEPSCPVITGELYGKEVLFLPRHGSEHHIPPHKINYRANIWALKNAGAKNVFAVAAVGGIREEMVPGQLVIPNQIVDYTYSRKHTFFEEGLESVTHIDFTYPYSLTLRKIVIDVAKTNKVSIIDGATYAATQGPRLETAAEIDRLDRDGCHIVGMTGMPEASLARELELPYAVCAVVVNRGAGRGEGEITMQTIERYLTSGMQRVEMILEQLVNKF